MGATSRRELVQRIPWLWYDHVVSRVPVPLWLLSLLVFAIVYGFGILMALLDGELRRFLGDPRWLAFGIMPGGTAYTLGAIPRAVDRFWQSIRPWTANSKVEFTALQAETEALLTRFFWPTALLFFAVVGVNGYSAMPGNWALDYAHPQLLSWSAAFGAPFVGYFFGGASSIATFGLALFAHRLRRGLELKPGFIFQGGKASFQPFNHLLVSIWLTIALPVVLILILEATTTATAPLSSVGFLSGWYLLQALPVILLTVPSLVVPQLFMNRLLAHEKAQDLAALRRQLEEAAAVPESRELFDVLERIHRHQHLAYQIQKVESFTPTLVDTRLLLQIGTSIATILLANVLLRTVIAQFL